MLSSAIMTYTYYHILSYNITHFQIILFGIVTILLSSYYHSIPWYSHLLSKLSYNLILSSTITHYDVLSCFIMFCCLLSTVICYHTIIIHYLVLSSAIVTLPIIKYYHHSLPCVVICCCNITYYHILSFTNTMNISGYGHLLC